MIITTKRKRERERTSSRGRQHIMGTVVSDSRAHEGGFNGEQLKPRKYYINKRRSTQESCQTVFSFGYHCTQNCT